MNGTLQAFAGLYRRSSAGRGGATKDYVLDWEKFLRATDRDDGDARELAVRELFAAERLSGGRFVIDRDLRTGGELRLRLKRRGGEEWLFSVTGMPAPAEERKTLAAYLRDGREIPVPENHAGGWRAWLERLAASALAGGPVTPFKRDDPTGNQVLLEALAGVLNWRGESLIRYASTVICRDSKALEALRPRLHAALREVTGRETASLDDFGISDTPRSVLIHGPLVLGLPHGRIDFGVLTGPVSISATDLAEARSVECGAASVLTVENESVFRELAKRRPGVLLVQTSFPGAATRLLFDRLPAELRCRHFGDSDPAGFDILRDLREKTGRRIEPVMMRFRHRVGAPELTDGERRDIERLLGSPVLEDVHDELRSMSCAGTKGDFEQESVSPDVVLKALPR